MSGVRRYYFARPIVVADNVYRALGGHNFRLVSDSKFATVKGTRQLFIILIGEWNGLSSFSLRPGQVVFSAYWEARCDGWFRFRGHGKSHTSHHPLEVVSVGIYCTLHYSWLFYSIPVYFLIDYGTCSTSSTEWQAITFTVGLFNLCIRYNK